MWDFFLRSLSPLAELCFILCHPLPCLVLLQEAFSHIQNISSPYSMYIMVHEPLTLHFVLPARGSVNVQTALEKRTWTKLLWPTTKQPDSLLDGNVSRAAQEERGGQQTSVRANKPHTVIKFCFYVCIFLVLLLLLKIFSPSTTTN